MKPNIISFCTFRHNTSSFVQICPVVVRWDRRTDEHSEAATCVSNLFEKCLARNDRVYYGHDNHTLYDTRIKNALWVDIWDGEGSKSPNKSEIKATEITRTGKCKSTRNSALRGAVQRSVSPQISCKCRPLPYTHSMQNTHYMIT
jgi:hypothetical protein